MAITYALAFVDRAIVGLMMQEISNDLHISRTNTSLLVGTGFAVVFSLAGVAVALFLSHIQPRLVVGLGVVVWSLATVGCALAQTPAAFLVARMGVGIGEAALVPMAYAWISMRAPHQRLGLAMACFTMGVSLGNGLSLGVGGQVIEWLTATLGEAPTYGLSPWRMVLVACGLLGLPVAALVMLVDREPVPGIARPNLGAGWPRPFPTLCLFLGFACIVGVYYIQLFWAVEFFRTSFGLGLSSVALLLGIAAGPGVAVGALMGGAIGDRIAKQNIVLPHAQMMIWASALQLSLFALAFLSNDVRTSIGAFIAAMVAHGAVGGAMGPSIAQLFSTEKRALATSIGIGFSTFGGLGVAMPLVGWMAEIWDIRSAMAWSATILLLASMILLALARQVRRA
ncbi:MAG: MFS transporter [Hyphomonadaceae bacterium]